MGRKSILEPGGVLDKSRYVSDLVGKQAVEQLVLRQKNGIFPLGQNLSRESIFQPPFCRTRRSVSLGCAFLFG